MVAISLYRGNLHRVPDVPRRWLMPTPQISLKDFKVLLNRRSRALSRLRSSSFSSSSAAAAVAAAITATATASNPSPSDTDLVPNQLSEVPKEEGDASRPEAQLGPSKPVVDCGVGPSGEDNDRKGGDFDGSSANPVNGSIPLPGPKPEDAPEKASDPVEGGANSQDVRIQKAEDLANPSSEVFGTFYFCVFDAWMCMVSGVRDFFFPSSFKGVN